MNFLIFDAGTNDIDVLEFQHHRQAGGKDLELARSIPGTWRLCKKGFDVSNQMIAKDNTIE